MHVFSTQCIFGILPIVLVTETKFISPPTPNTTYTEYYNT